MVKKATPSMQQISKDKDPIYSPISTANPAGNDLRYTTLYDTIKKARLNEDSSLPQGVWEYSLKKSDYKQVADLSYKALCEQSKDLQLAAWLAESWIVSYGSEGLLQGFSMLKNLIDVFWSTLYPKLDNPLDPSMRLAPLKWINEKFPEKISAHIPLAPINEKNISPLTLTEYIQAQEIEKQLHKTKESDAKRESYKRQGVHFLNDYARHLESTPQKYYIDLYKNFEETTKLLMSIELYIKNQLPDHPFAFTKIKKLFREYNTILQPYLTKKKEDIKVVTKETTEPSFLAEPSKTTLTSSSELVNKDSSKPKKKSSTPNGSVPILDLSDIDTSTNSRQKIYAQLEKITTYLLKLEPHSPAPYLVRKSIAWSNMTLEEIFNEIKKEDVDLKQFMSWLGMGKD